MTPEMLIMTGFSRHLTSSHLWGNAGLFNEKRSISAQTHTVSSGVSHVQYAAAQACHLYVQLS